VYRSFFIKLLLLTLFTTTLLAHALPAPTTFASAALEGRAFPAGTAITSSGTAAGSHAAMIDGDVNTSWTSYLVPVLGNGPWITFALPSSQYVSAVQLVTTAPLIGAHSYRVYETTCCAHNQIGSTSISVTTGEHSTIIPVTPGNYNKLTLMVDGSAGLLIKEIRLLPIEAPTVLSATPGDGYAVLEWAPVSASTLAGYRIYVNGVLYDTTSDTSHAVAGLTNGQSYSFSVKAYDTSLRESQSSAWPTVVPRDAVPPAAPTGLVATPGDGQVALAWSANADSDLAYYRIYVNQALVADNVAGTSYTVGSLTSGSAYQFEVAAVDTSGNESPPSAAANATPFDSTPPAVPAGLAATPGDRAVSLTWSANTESDFERYAIYKNGSPYNEYVYSTSTTVTGLTNGTGYSFSIRAIDEDGNASALSASVSATPADVTAPSAPIGLTATAGDGTVLLQWTANPESDFAKYKVYMDGELFDGDVTTNGYTAAGLTKGTSYSFAVTAVDTSGNESDHSGTVSATPVDDVDPAVPTGLVATPGDGTATLSWTANTDADLAKYRVYRDGVLIRGSVTASTYLATGLTNDIPYSFAVTAVDTSGNESEPTTVTVTPKLQSIRVVLPTGKLQIGEEIIFRVELRTADGTYQDVTDAVYDVEFSEPAIVSFKPMPHRLAGLTTGKVDATVRYMNYATVFSLYVDFEGWVRKLANPTAERTDIAHLVNFLADRELDVNDDSIFDKADVRWLLHLIEPRSTE
jgi:fibronectin type 3 domain-containing protein